jgi:hypothetical protein
VVPNFRQFCYLKNLPSNQSPDGRKLTQSGHPDAKARTLLSGTQLGLKFFYKKSGKEVKEVKFLVQVKGCQVVFFQTKNPD